MAAATTAAAICVQVIDAQCVLQFTSRHAACCALHRFTSRVIHRSEFCFLSLRLATGPTAHAPPTFRRAGHRPVATASPHTSENRKKNHHDVRRDGRRQRTDGRPVRPSVRRRSLSLATHGQLPVVRQPPTTTPGTLCPARRYEWTIHPPPGQTDRPTLVTECDADRPADVATTRHLDGRTTDQDDLPARALMILPQVHLRKPCYDFYFL